MQQYGVTPPVVTAKMLQYAHLRYGLHFAHVVYVWLVLICLLQAGWASALGDRVTSLVEKRGLQLPVYLCFLYGIIALLQLPFGIFSDFYVEHAFGLSQQSFVMWLGDYLKAQLIVLLEAYVAWTTAFFVMAKFPKRWPLLLWALLTPVIALMIFLYPLVVDPQFNKYTPMQAGTLRSSIRQLASMAGIAEAPVFIVDKSRQTSKLNAEVTGLGSSARVVIWDTTLNRLPADQVLSIVGHELGHYALGHVMIGFTLVSLALLAGLLAAGRFAQKLLVRLPKRWRIDDLTDLAVIPAVMLALSILSFLTAPIENAVSRQIEHEADVFGLTITHDRGAMARTFVSLSHANLSDPDPPPFIVFWLFSHPTLRDRIDFALGIKR